MSSVFTSQSCGSQLSIFTLLYLHLEKHNNFGILDVPYEGKIHICKLIHIIVSEQFIPSKLNRFLSVKANVHIYSQVLIHMIFYLTHEVISIFLVAYEVKEDSNFFLVIYAVIKSFDAF